MLKCRHYHWRFCLLPFPFPPACPRRIFYSRCGGDLSCTLLTRDRHLHFWAVILFVCRIASGRQFLSSSGEKLLRPAAASSGSRRQCAHFLMVNASFVSAARELLLEHHNCSYTRYRRADMLLHTFVFYPSLEPADIH